MEYYSTIKNEEILLFATTWMELQGTMLGEYKSDRKDKYCMISLICKILKLKKKRTRKRVGPVDTTDRRWVEGRIGLEEGGQKVQISSYKISKSQGCNVHTMAIADTAV